MVTRFALSDVELGQRKLRAGDMAYVVIGAANRDPARFAAPDVFDINRADSRHLSFGISIHFCLGAPLARVLIATALSALIARYGQFRLLEMQRGGTLLLRGPGRLVVGGE
jgi:unspecific monooxygenase